MSWISTEPMGFGEAVINADAEHRFQNFRRISVAITPDLAWRAISHIQASGFNSPGYAPIVVGMAAAGVPAGSRAASQIYNRAATVSSQEGIAFDDDLDPREKIRRIQEQIRTENQRMGLNDIVSYTEEDLKRFPGLADQHIPEDEPWTVFGALKGASRWFFLGLDALPDGIDAMGRAVSAIKQGQLSPQEAAAGMLQGTPFAGVVGLATGAGLTDEQIDRAGTLVGIPFFQYARAGLQGERLNMGEGWFATGEVASDVTFQMAQYDSQTESREEFLRQVQANNGRAVVYGPGGANYQTNDFEEWQWLRNQTGRAAVLEQAQAGSAEQEGMGQAFGSFNPVFENALIGEYAHRPGRYFSYNTGNALAGMVYDRDSVNFRSIANTINFGKEIADLNLLGVTARSVFSGTRGAIGLSDEAGQVVRANRTMEHVLGGADLDAVGRAQDDFLAGRVNVEAAANALARQMDDPLSQATTLVGFARSNAPRILDTRRTAEVEELVGRGIAPSVAENMVKPILSEARVDALLRKAGKGDTVARTWLDRLLNDIPDADPADVINQLDNYTAVTARGSGVDLVGGRFGKADVSDEIMGQARANAEDLADAFTRRKGSAVYDDKGRLAFTFDADLGRAQQTLADLTTAVGDQTVARGDAAREFISAQMHLEDIQAQISTGRAVLGTAVGVLRQGDLDAAVNRLNAAVANPNLAGVVRLDKAGRARVVNGEALGRFAASSADDVAGDIEVMARNLFNERTLTRREAARLLGDDDVASDAIDNLSRVLKRNGSADDLVDGISAFRPKMPQGRYHEMLTGSNPAIDDMLDSLIGANVRTAMSVLGPTVEHSGRIIPGRLFGAFEETASREDVMEVLLRSASPTTKIQPRRMFLQGMAAKAGAAATIGGGVAGGVAGGIQAADTTEGIGEIIGGAMTGAILGAVAGSGAAGSVAGLLGRGLGRDVDRMADVMDLMLAGTRAVTTQTLVKAGVPMNYAVQGLSVPGQLGYALGHTPMGRRIARHARQRVDLGDPDSMFYTLYDWARQFGVKGDEQVSILHRGVGESRETLRVRTADFDDMAAFEAEIAGRVGDGFTVTRHLDLNTALRNIGEITPRNTARGWVALREFFDGIENLLVAKGMSEEIASFLTRFAKEGADEFVGNVNAVGGGANLAAQLAIRGNLQNLDDGARMVSELWSGKIDLPPPELVTRALGQLDALGRFTQAFTGAGVATNVIKKLSLHSPNVPWAEVLTPRLERNIVMTMTRAVTLGVWTPAMLLTRPMSFLGRVIGEDQARMLVSGLDNVITHPFHYLSSTLANFDFWKNKGVLRGVTGRSAIPDHVFDDFYDAVGNARPDALDDMAQWGPSETALQGLGIYDRQAAKGKQLFGAQIWTTIRRGASNYTAALSREFRFLVADPIAVRLANSKATDPVESTFRWLMDTDEGRRVYQRWAIQFDGNPERAAQYMRPEVVKGVIADEWARLHLKTGGDWVFVLEDQGVRVVFNSRAEKVTEADVAARGFDQFPVGYNIIRRGDESLLETVRTGRTPVRVDAKGNRTGDVDVAGPLDDDALAAIDDLMARTHDRFETNYKSQVGQVADPMVLHRFPEQVKGTKTRAEIVGDKDSGRQRLSQRWDDALDRYYDFILGTPTNILSRQPVMGNFYWEQIGMLLPSMTPRLRKIYEEIALKEGGPIMGKTLLTEIRRIAAATDEGGRVAREVLTNGQMIDLRAKAYAVERTKDTLFDLTRQRNFIDGLRVVMPFAGPMVEALEAWGRVIKANPVYAWRRGGQVVSGLWRDDPLAQATPNDERGMFWVDEDGTQMVTIPFTGQIMSWLHRTFSEGIDPDPISARARGFNIVFGPDDLSDPSQPTFLGFPIGALNPGTGPGFNLVVGAVMSSRQGTLGQLEDFLFPYGPAANGWEMMLPFHIRKAVEGSLGEASRQEKVVSAVEQWQQMVASGDVGEGPGFRFDVSTPGGRQAAWKEAHTRATWAQWVEGVARGSLPSMTSPELEIEVAQIEELGIDSERLIKVHALASEARDLFSEEGAKWLEFEDGLKVSTEGDWEAVTEWLNRNYGLNMYSAELLTLGPTRTVYPRSLSDSGLKWSKGHEGIVGPNGILPNSGSLLMADYANVEADEEFSFAARDHALKTGAVTFATSDEMSQKIAAHLLAMRGRQIEAAATAQFGDDELLEGEDQNVKDNWIASEKERARGIYHQTEQPVGVRQRVFDEIVGSWQYQDWESLELSDEEMATVKAVLWYLDARSMALSYAQAGGLTRLGNVGSSDDEKMAAEAARSDLRNLVERQLQIAIDTNMDLGNFVYIYTTYLSSELEEDEEDEDPLEDLARITNLGLDSYMGRPGP